MKKIIFLIYICLFTFWGKAWSLIEVDITRGNLNPLPLAVSPLSVDQNSKEKFKDLLKLEDIGVEISKVVENNLRQSGLFIRAWSRISEFIMVPSGFKFNLILTRRSSL